MKHLSFTTLLSALLLTACGMQPRVPEDDRRTAVNPDPNHTHADFAVYIRNEKIDFARPEFMSDTEGYGDEANDHDDHEHKHPYLHLHDGVGHVIHRHKPGLALAEFFESIGFTMTNSCMTVYKGEQYCDTGKEAWVMIINGEEGRLQPEYVFTDLDQILLSYGASSMDPMLQWKEMTDDSCLYSKTCPERGEAPPENCVADPNIPCVVPLEDL